MKIDNNAAIQLAEAARLNLTETELAQVVQHLNNFLQLIEPLSEVNTKNIEPLLFPVTQNHE